MYISKTSVLFTLLPSAFAATCNLQTAQTYVAGVTGVSNNPNSSLQDQIDSAYVQCSTGCGSAAQCLVNCLSTACSTYCKSKTSSSCQSSCISDPCSAFYGSGSATPNADELNKCYKAKFGGKSPNNAKRATLDCASNQGCYKETSGNYFCLDLSTGNYVDYEGGKGNIRSGAYTSGTPSAGGAASSTTSAGTRATSVAAGAASTVTSAGAAGPTTSNTPSNGMRTFGADSALGALGVALALIL